MKEFLEKRWWQGVGGIAGIIALVLVVLQFLGIVDISGLAVSIALNIILAITLALVATWAAKWKRKYEDVSGQLEKLIEARKQVTKRQRILLLDPNYIWKLNIDNAILTEMYGEAHGRAIAKFHDAKLRGVAILVFPYQEDKVSIHFEFYSSWADRGCTFMVGEMGDMVEAIPDKDWERVTFEELPWLRDPDWLQFVRKSCEKVGPLSPAEWTNYIVSVTPQGERRWNVSFEDGLTGEESNFYWYGKGDPIPGGRG